MKNRELSYYLLLKPRSLSLRVQRALGKHHSSREQKPRCLRLQPWHTIPLPTLAFQVAVYQGISGSLRGCVPQTLLFPAEGLWGSFQTYIIPVLNSPRGAAPWIIAFLAAVACG